MVTVAWLVVVAVAVYFAYRLGKRDQWIEPHCYCRGDQLGHGCLEECWQGHRLRSAAYQQHMRRPQWLRRFYTRGETK